MVAVAVCITPMITANSLKPLVMSMERTSFYESLRERWSSLCCEGWFGCWSWHCPCCSLCSNSYHGYLLVSCCCHWTVCYHRLVLLGERLCGSTSALPAQGGGEVQLRVPVLLQEVLDGGVPPLWAEGLRGWAGAGDHYNVLNIVSGAALAVGGEVISEHF